MNDGNDPAGEVMLMAASRAHARRLTRRVRLPQRTGSARGGSQPAALLCSAAAARAATPAVVPPTRSQLVQLALAAGLPFIAFGVADNGIMILAGDQIDATLGVRFGLSTLAAAGFGNLISDVVGVVSGQSIEAGVARMGVHAPQLSVAQNALRVTQLTKVTASSVGVAVGCLIGMAPLMVIRNRKQATRLPPPPPAHPHPALHAPRLG